MPQSAGKDVALTAFRPSVIRARVALGELREAMAASHGAGVAAVETAARASDATDSLVDGLWQAVVADLPPGGASLLGGRLVLVAHGGYGRREMAPFSDVDLMLLHDLPAAGDSGSELLTASARRLLQDLCDAGVEVGQSVRTVDDAVRLARTDAAVMSSLIDARPLWGAGDLLQRLAEQLRGLAARGQPRLTRLLLEARASEKAKYGESMSLLEPNVKRSPGGLRDIQMVRWLGFMAEGTSDPGTLAERGVISSRDVQTLRAAAEFLTGVRIDLHLHAGRCADDLTRDHQQRLARQAGILPLGGLLPVERMMRDYFRHTRGVLGVVEGLEARGRRPHRLRSWVEGMLGHRIEGRYLVGPTALQVLPDARDEVAATPAAILRLIELSQLYGLPIDAESWHAIRAANTLRVDASELPQHSGDAATAGPDVGWLAPRRDASPVGDDPPSLLAEERERFLAILERPQRIGESLRRLHEIGLLERLIPDFAHARDLLQFNNYHKYTVDEHSIRAVELAAALASDSGWLGDVWRQIGRKRVLMLALLIHDLGKGYEEDHSEVGRRIAVRIATRLGLTENEVKIVEFLVHRHLVMAHLAFRRDASDESLVVRLACDVGSPEVLRMLSVLTASDVAAVGPGVWTKWKADLLRDLHLHTLGVLDGESPSALAERHRRDLEGLLAEWEVDDPVVRIGRQLPISYLRDTQPSRIIEELVQLARLPADKAFVATRWQPETSTLAVTVGTREDVAPGVFHRLTGALAAERLEVLAADIHTLDDGLVIDHFVVLDPDYAGAPPADRLADISAAIRTALKAEAVPEIARRLNPLAPRPNPAMHTPVRVLIDNDSSQRSTILEVFANDSPGLLSSIARVLFDAGVSVQAAKIGTYLDQVVDAFHLTDHAGGKIVDQERLEALRRAVEAVASAR